MKVKESFISDVEKMADLLYLIVFEKGEKIYNSFLSSYSYISREEIEKTIEEIDSVALAHLYRRAKNIFIEEINGRETGMSVTSEQIKDSITRYVYGGFMSDAEIKEFEECCEAC